MANVTFIVGNGIDLSLDLKTSYRDFYAYTKKNKLHTDNRIYKAIQESPETWSDFEFTLGKYTQYIERLSDKHKKQESVRLHDELEEVRDDLAEYLASQEKIIEESTQKFQFTRSNFFEELPLGPRNKFHSLTAGTSNLRFIILNYTKTLENLLPRRLHFTSQSLNVATLLHLHGDLQSDLTLGVSDESQLSTSMTGAERDDLIKPTLISSMNDGRMDEFESIVSTSNIIVIYGTSIGETDKYIWQKIVNWLDDNPATNIIIHKHDSSYTDSVRRSSRRQKQYNQNVQDKLLRHSALDGDAMAE